MRSVIVTDDCGDESEPELIAIFDDPKDAVALCNEDSYKYDLYDVPHGVKIEKDRHQINLKPVTWRIKHVQSDEITARKLSQSELHKAIASCNVGLSDLTKHRDDITTWKFNGQLYRAWPDGWELATEE
jgi:hypothetical protein